MGFRSDRGGVLLIPSSLALPLNQMLFTLIGSWVCGQAIVCRPGRPESVQTPVCGPASLGAIEKKVKIPVGSEAKPKPKYRRILLKLSGEVLRQRQTGDSIDPQIVRNIACRVKRVTELGVEVGIVLGGGNIFRGAMGEACGIGRVSGDYMGMLSTIINGLAMQNALESLGLATRLQTAIEMQRVAEPFIQRKAVNHLEKGRVVIFAGGTGNPFFSTDTAAALRASEIGAQVLLKATKVDGVYSADPAKVTNARRYKALSYQDALRYNLKVMDATAFALCMDNHIPIVVFNFVDDADAILRVVLGETIGTLVTDASRLGGDGSSTLL